MSAEVSARQMALQGCRTRIQDELAGSGVGAVLLLQIVEHHVAGCTKAPSAGTTRWWWWWQRKPCSPVNWSFFSFFGGIGRAVRGNGWGGKDSRARARRAGGRECYRGGELQPALFRTPATPVRPPGGPGQEAAVRLALATG